MWEKLFRWIETACKVLLWVVLIACTLPLLLLMLSGLIDVLLAIGTHHERPCRIACMNNLRQIGEACVMYSQDYGGFYPTVRDEATAVSRPMASLALLYGKYVPAEKKSIFTCPSTSDSCADMAAGKTFRAHNTGKHASWWRGDRLQCSYGYDDTRGPGTPTSIVIASDAPQNALTPIDSTYNRYNRNSDNHYGDGQNILFYGGNRVLWATGTKNPEIETDDIYAPDPKNPGVSDSCIH